MAKFKRTVEAMNAPVWIEEVFQDIESDRFLVVYNDGSALAVDAIVSPDDDSDLNFLRFDGKRQKTQSFGNNLSYEYERLWDRWIDRTDPPPVAFNEKAKSNWAIVARRPW